MNDSQYQEHMRQSTTVRVHQFRSDTDAALGNFINMMTAVILVMSPAVVISLYRWVF